MQRNSHSKSIEIGCCTMDTLLFAISEEYLNINWTSSTNKIRSNCSIEPGAHETPCAPDKVYSAKMSCGIYPGLNLIGACHTIPSPSLEPRLSEEARLQPALQSMFARPFSLFSLVTHTVARNIRRSMAESTGSTCTCKLTRLKLISWNIDGLDENNLKERTEFVCHFINSYQPHIVFLQEVIYETLSIIREALSPVYAIYAPPKIICNYFTVIIVKNCPAICTDGEVGQFDFPGSVMGRHLLQLYVKVCGIPIALFTSHLESMKDYAIERKTQLRLCFEFIEEQRKSFNRTCIFGGDLNLRDDELAAVGLPASIVDVWEACGSVKEHKYTWDVSKNDNLNWRYQSKPKVRYDRIYFSGIADYVKPHSFKLIGKERIPSCNRFPSDHWGMWAEFDVSEFIDLSS